MARQYHYGLFALVESAAVSSVGALPSSYQGLGLADLRALGYYPLVENAPAKESWEDYEVDDYTIGAESVTRNWTKTLDLARYKAAKISEVSADAESRVIGLDSSWTATNAAQKQRQAITRGVKLARKIAEGEATASEVAEADVLETLGDYAAAIRTKAEDIVVDITAAANKTAVDAAVTEWDNWSHV